MANELRVRSGAVGGLVEDNPLAANAVALNSAGLAALPVIGATQHMALIFDPDGLTGAPFVKWVTAHTAGATTATITAAAQEGFTERPLDRDIPWVHGPTLWDFEYPRCKLRRTADSAALTASAWTSVTWDAEEIDSHAMHDTAVNADRITIVRAGDYELDAMIHLQGNSIAGVRFKKNGVLANTGANAGVTLPMAPYGNAGVGNAAYGSVMARCVVGDYFTCEAYAGGAVAIEADNSYFQAKLITMGEL